MNQVAVNKKASAKQKSSKINEVTVIEKASGLSILFVFNIHYIPFSYDARFFYCLFSVFLLIPRPFEGKEYFQKHNEIGNASIKNIL